MFSAIYGIFHLVVLVAFGEMHWAFSKQNTDSGACSMEHGVPALAGVGIGTEGMGGLVEGL